MKATMAPNLLIVKLILTPLIIILTTLVSRRWGERVGGMMTGLPLTSGPVSVFFALEQGPAFAASAAAGSILGLVAVAAFCVAYVQAARRGPWPLAALAGIGGYLAAVLVISALTPNLLPEVIIIPLLLIASIRGLGKIKAQPVAIRSAWWDLPLRIILATTILVTVTTLAGRLGAKWSGVLSPFPIFTFVMSTFAHSQGGAPAAWRFMRGVLTGLFSYVIFFLIVGLSVARMPLAAAYGVATAAALGVNALSLALQLRSEQADQATLPPL